MNNKSTEANGIIGGHGTYAMPLLSEGDRLLTTKEAAPIVGLKPVSLNMDRVNNHLGIPYVKIGSKAVRYRLSDLMIWINNLPGRSSTSQVL